MRTQSHELVHSWGDTTFFYEWGKRGKSEKDSIYSAFYAALKTVEQDFDKACQQRLNKLLDRKIALVKKQFQENDRPIKLTYAVITQ